MLHRSDGRDFGFKFDQTVGQVGDFCPLYPCGFLVMSFFFLGRDRQLGFVLPVFFFLRDHYPAPQGNEAKPPHLGHLLELCPRVGLSKADSTVYL